jgi:hypothetical protein
MWWNDQLGSYCKGCGPCRLGFLGSPRSSLSSCAPGRSKVTESEKPDWAAGSQPLLENRKPQRQPAQTTSIRPILVTEAPIPPVSIAVGLCIRGKSRTTFLCLSPQSQLVVQCDSLSCHTTSVSSTTLPSKSYGPLAVHVPHTEEILIDGSLAHGIYSRALKPAWPAIPSSQG